MRDLDYPALFRSADSASNANQRKYLWLIRIEYALLFVAAVFSMNLFSSPDFYLAYALVFVIATAALLIRALSKPEQDWYRCRALAESVKTLTWRYVMRASPFQENPTSGQIARSEFRNQLQSMLNENKETAAKIASNFSADDQVTEEMERIRSKSRGTRMAYYLENRINDQRTWYAKKAAWNKVRANFWVGAGVVSYAVAVALVLSRIRYPLWIDWPIEPVIVFASSVIGWMQIKKFNELGAAYTVAAHEIGLIKLKVDEANDDSSFSEFVNDAELAFSREHTLWIARQSD